MNSVLPLNYTLEEIYAKYKTLASPSPASKMDVEWWIGIKRARLGTLRYHPDPTITEHSDVSNKGWSTVLNGQSQTRAYGLPRRQLTKLIF